MPFFIWCHFENQILQAFLQLAVSCGIPYAFYTSEQQCHELRSNFHVLLPVYIFILDIVLYDSLIVRLFCTLFRIWM